MGLLSFLGFGSGKIKEALKKGAMVIDVRTPQEFDRGHIPEAIHIPVDRIRIQAPRIKAMNRSGYPLLQFRCKKQPGTNHPEIRRGKRDL